MISPRTRIAPSSWVKYALQPTSGGAIVAPTSTAKRVLYGDGDVLVRDWFRVNVPVAGS
jgi:hypothetical protein